MKEKIVSLENRLNQHDSIIRPIQHKIDELYSMKEKVDGLHSWKGESNNLIQSLKGMFDILERNQNADIKSLKDEWNNNFKELKTEVVSAYKDITKDVAKLTNWKFLLIGGGIVAIGAFNVAIIYLNYHK